ncbi:MAG: hypothetical protein ACKO1U_04570 [Bacteroidota bacterium]
MAITLVILALVIISHIYMNWSGKAPAGLIDLSEYFKKSKEKGRFWELLQVITTPLVFIYNQIVLVIWLFSGLLSWGVWLFQNLVVDGVWLVVRLLLHYLVLWPWRIVRMAFEQIKPTWSRRTYRLGATGIFLSGAAYFLGRYLVLQWGLNEAVRYFFTVASMLPLAWTLSRIASIRHAEKYGESDNSKTPLYLLLFIGTALGILALQYVLYLIASKTFLAPVFTALFAGGSILLSGLLVFNCIIVLFLLSVLPQHLFYSATDLRTLSTSLLHHLKNKWPQYIFGALAISIPAFLLSLLPSLLITGSVKLASTTGIRELDRNIESRRSSLQIIEPAFEEWIDPKKTSDQQMDSLVAAYGEYQKEDLAISDLELVRNSLQSALEPYGGPVGTLPVAAVYKAYQVYDSTGNRMVGTDPAVSHQAAAEFTQQVAATCDNDIDHAGQLNDKLKATLNGARQEKDRLEKELEDQKKLCAGTYCPPPMIAPEERVAEKPAQEYVADKCPRIKELEAAIEQESDHIAYLEEMAARLTRLRDSITLKNERLSSSASARNLIFAIGYLLLGILVCAIAALVFGFIPGLFANMNYTIYHEDADQDDWKITALFKEANSRNPNQPLLGLLLSPFTLVALLWLASNLLHLATGTSLRKLADSPVVSGMQERIGTVKTGIKDRASLIKQWFPMPVSFVDYERGIQERLEKAYGDERLKSLENNLNHSSKASEVELPAAEAASPLSENMEAAAPATDTASPAEQSADDVLMEMERQRIREEEDAEQAAAEEAPSENGSAESGYAYYVLVQSYSNQNDAEDAQRTFASRGIRLSVVTPGTFLGDNDQYYLLCAGFNVTLFEAQRIKNEMASKGLSCSIQRY